MDTKTCSRCHQTKPLTAFRKRSDSTHRYRSHCRECIQRSTSIYDAAHREQRNAWNRQYRKEHSERDRERHRERRRAWIARLREQGINYYAIQYQIHAEKKRLYGRTYGRANRTTLRIKERQRYHANPARRLADRDRYRSRKRGAPLSNLTLAQWREILVAYGYRCVYCERKMKRLSQDHIIPLSKGGTHTFDNVVPACRSCNSSKKDGPPLKPVQPLLLTIAPAKKKKV